MMKKKLADYLRNHLSKEWSAAEAASTISHVTVKLFNTIQHLTRVEGTLCVELLSSKEVVSGPSDLARHFCKVLLFVNQCCSDFLTAELKNTVDDVLRVGGDTPGVLSIHDLDLASWCSPQPHAEQITTAARLCERVGLCKFRSL